VKVHGDFKDFISLLNANGVEYAVNVKNSQLKTHNS